MINLESKIVYQENFNFCILDGFHVVVLLNDARNVYIATIVNDRHAMKYTISIMCQEMALYSLAKNKIERASSSLE